MAYGAIDVLCCIRYKRGVWDGGCAIPVLKWRYRWLCPVLTLFMVWYSCGVCATAVSSTDRAYGGTDDDVLRCTAPHTARSSW
eukprot:3755789-Rhodomonas_salina.2